MGLVKSREDGKNTDKALFGFSCNSTWIEIIYDIEENNS